MGVRSQVVSNFLTWTPNRAQLFPHGLCDIADTVGTYTIQVCLLALALVTGEQFCSAHVYSYRHVTATATDHEPYVTAQHR